MSKSLNPEIIETATNHFCDLFQLSSCMERYKVEAMGVTRLQGYAIMQLFHEETLSLQELATNVRLASSTMSRVMDKLVERELVERDFDVNDRRRMIFQLSEDGQLLAETIHCCYEELYEMLMVEIPVDEQEKFLYNLGKILDKMRETFEEHICPCKGIAGNLKNTLKN
ncbi:MAG: hypothetical protein A2161_16515 [Candidatus Schekmanbacteria bacterium RBG_13_48_7]|uniref:HTH marR-type domain-containing protein n=1 Tax=Candidatus Schekmanbacteria bacterium RBG_13_48_7 TaxID=1817878 RepID=A0A1F7RWG4_9BACT|nr:MAG: hypothetical protein A2161_16515 [Candidatus Schekmanbacteria bacterium RBG_13_48_7]